MTLTSIFSIILGIYLYKKFFHVEGEEQHIGLSQILEETQALPKVVNHPTKKKTNKPDILFYGRPAVGAKLSFILDPSDVFGVTVECIDGYDDGYGIYKEVYYEDSTKNILSCSTQHILSWHWSNKPQTPYKSMIHYNIYEPYRCRICGAPINNKNAFHNPLTRSKINTAILPDSELRFCDNCKDIFREDTEDYFPFFMDFQNKKVITSWENKEEFLQYMKKAYFVSAVAWDVYNETDMLEMYETFGFTIDESLANLTRLEYTKNADTAAMYNSIRGLL